MFGLFIYVFSFSYFFDILLQIAETLGHLSTAYIDLGNPPLSVSLLQHALDINKQVHSPNHIAVAITLSLLSNTYCHLGDLAHNEQYAKEHLLRALKNPFILVRQLMNQVWWSLCYTVILEKEVFQSILYIYVTALRDIMTSE